MEYACLCWLNASPTILSQLDNIQRKALKIIGADEATAQQRYNISSLQHRRSVAAVCVLYKMHTQQCPADLNSMLPEPAPRRRTTRSSESMPAHCLSVPRSNTRSLDRSFLHKAIEVWNQLPECIVGEPSRAGLQCFKAQAHRYLSTV